MIFLDTHLLVWLYSGEVKKLSKRAAKLIDEEELFVSSMSILELQYLFEVKRISKKGRVIFEELHSTLGLQESQLPLQLVIKHAMSLSWTRDAFDRLILANTLAEKAKLLTKDKILRQHSRYCIW